MPRRDGWSDMLGDYQHAQRAAGRSEGTIRLHRYRLLDLAEKFRTPAAVTTDQLVQLLAHEGWAPETRKSVRGAYRAFFKWAHDAGRLDADPAAKLPPVRVPPGVPRPAPEHVVARGLALDDRTRLMVLLAAYAGLRAGEIAQVHADDLDGDVLHVHGKGGRERAVPIAHPELLARLEELDGWAFPSRARKSWHLTPGHVSRLISRALPGKWSAHPLRHRFGTMAYAGTRDLLAVQQLLGHSRPETTQRYVQLPQDALRAAVRAVVAA